MKKTIYSKEGRMLTAWLRSCRLKEGLSMRAFCRKLNVPHSWIGKVELGQRRLDVVEYVRYCQELGVDPHEGIERLMSYSRKRLRYPASTAKQRLPVAAETDGAYKTGKRKSRGIDSGLDNPGLPRRSFSE